MVFRQSLFHSMMESSYGSLRNSTLLSTFISLVIDKKVPQKSSYILIMLLILISHPDGWTRNRPPSSWILHRSLSYPFNSEVYHLKYLVMNFACFPILKLFRMGDYSLQCNLFGQFVYPSIKENQYKWTDTRKVASGINKKNPLPLQEKITQQ